MLRRLKRIYSAIKLGWNDQDWDHVYMLIAFKWKIDHMLGYWQQEHAIGYIGQEKDAKMLFVCSQLLARLIESKYLEQYEPSMDVNDLFKDIFPDLKVITPNQHAKAERQEDQDWEYLWDVVKKNGRKWWI